MKAQERVNFSDVETDLIALSGKLNVAVMALAQTTFEWNDDDISGLGTMMFDIKNHFQTVHAYCYQAFEELNQAKRRA